MQIAKTFSLAERLGGQIRCDSRAATIRTEILRLARRENVTQIVLGQSRAGWWRRLSAGRCRTRSCATPAPSKFTSSRAKRRRGIRPGRDSSLQLRSEGARRRARGRARVGRLRRRRRRSADARSAASEPLDDLPDRGAVQRRACTARARRSSPRSPHSSPTTSSSSSRSTLSPSPSRRSCSRC